MRLNKIFSLLHSGKMGIWLFLILLHGFYNVHSQNTKTNRIASIVVDPGHGGKDPGCVSKAGFEKTVTLNVSKLFAKYVNDCYKDVKVILTRETDEYVELHKRAAIANKAKADLFISIHVNANKKKTPFGAETFVMGLHRTQGNLDVTMAENSVILKEKDYTKEYEGFDIHSPEGYIIFSLYQNTFLEQSLNFATKVQYHFREKAGRFDRGVKQAGFLVLWKTAMPSVLIELGFLSNKEEGDFLLSDKGQQYLAYAIFNAFKDYKTEVERNSNSNNCQLTPEGYEKNKPGKSITDTTQADTLQNSLKKGTEKLPEEKNNDTKKEIKTESYSNSTAADKGDNQIIFKIQITSSSKKIPLQSELFKGLQNVEEYEIDGVFKYTVCKSTEYKDIENLQKLIRADFPNSFIIAFKNGKKIPVSDALKELKK